MTDYATLTQLKNGNLEISLGKDGFEEIADLRADGKRTDDDILLSLIENYFGNGYNNLTGMVGLTDSLIIGYGWDLTDEGNWELIEGSQTWWFPNYMVENPLETLINEGKVIFKKGE
jgi:hypothetical protein